MQLAIRLLLLALVATTLVSASAGVKGRRDEQLEQRDEPLEAPTKGGSAERASSYEAKGEAPKAAKEPEQAVKGREQYEAPAKAAPAKGVEASERKAAPSKASPAKAVEQVKYQPSAKGYSEQRQYKQEKLVERDYKQEQQQLVVERDDSYAQEEQSVDLENDKRQEDDLGQLAEQQAPEEQQQQQEEEPKKAGVKGYQQEQEREASGSAEPYAFQYEVDGSSRRESGDTNGVVRGQYTLRGADGGQRIVDYVADRDGFRATVETNEFGTENRSPAGVALRSSQPLAEKLTRQLAASSASSGTKRAEQPAPKGAAPPSARKAPELPRKSAQLLGRSEIVEEAAPVPAESSESIDESSSSFNDELQSRSFSLASPSASFESAHRRPVSLVTVVGQPQRVRYVSNVVSRPVQRLVAPPRSRSVPVVAHQPVVVHRAPVAIASRVRQVVPVRVHTDIVDEQ